MRKRKKAKRKAKRIEELLASIIVVILLFPPFLLLTLLFLIFYLLYKALRKLYYVIQQSIKDRNNFKITSDSLYINYKRINSGHDFEKFMAYLLKKNNYRNIRITQKSGDQGVDVLAKRGNKKYALQCKFYKNKVGNSAVQQIAAGRNHYKADVGVVATNSMFTPSAIELAESNNILLWDGIKIEKMLRNAIKSKT